MKLKSRLKGNPTRYLFFSGKGGVGKTSIAAATALRFAKSGKTLIISTDPAHSLSDSFETDIGGEIKQLQKNLFAVEIDPQKAVEEYKEKLSGHLEKMEGLKAFGLEAFNMAEAAPGIDELAAFDKFLRYMNSKEYDVIIFDTAPTGHTLRFLSLPDVLESWVGKMISLRLKLASFAGIFKKFLPFGGEGDGMEKLGTEQLEEMKERIAEAKKILTDPKKTSYNLVLIPEEMAIFESLRSLKVLKGYKIPVKAAIVNQLIPENKGCRFCSAKRSVQQERLKTIRQRFGGMEVKTLRMFPHEVKGFKALETVAQELYGKG